jgi:hypothetical protein
MGKIAVYCENHMQHTKAPYGQNVQFHYDNAESGYSGHWALSTYFSIRLLVELKWSSFLCYYVSTLIKITHDQSIYGPKLETLLFFGT